VSRHAVLFRGNRRRIGERLLPTWSYSGGWGYYPSGLVGILLIIVIILLLACRI